MLARSSTYTWSGVVGVALPCTSMVVRRNNAVHCAVSAAWSFSYGPMPLTTAYTASFEVDLIASSTFAGSSMPGQLHEDLVVAKAVPLDRSL